MKHSFSAQELLELSQEDWKKWYNNYIDFFQFIEDELAHALNGFKRQLGNDPLAILAIRKKEEQSFIDKIIKVSTEAANAAIEKGTEYISIFDLFQDIVGARMVFYFSDDQITPMRYFSHYGLFVVDRIEVYDLFDDTHPQRNRELFDNIKQLFPAKAKFKAKESSYESIHMSVRFSSKHLQIQLAPRCFKWVA